MTKDIYLAEKFLHSKNNEAVLRIEIRHTKSSCLSCLVTFRCSNLPRAARPCFRKFQETGFDFYPLIRASARASGPTSHDISSAPFTNGPSSSEIFLTSSDSSSNVLLPSLANGLPRVNSFPRCLPFAPIFSLLFRKKDALLALKLPTPLRNSSAPIKIH